MMAVEDMRGQLFGLIVSALLLGEAYGLWRPQALGGLPQPDLGPFSHYRLVIALLTAGVGAVMLLASLFRDRGAEPTPTRRPAGSPVTFDLEPPSRARMEQAMRPAVRAPAPAAVVTPLPAPPAQVAAPTSPAAPAPPRAVAPVPVEDVDELDPFPGLDHMPAPPPKRIPISPTMPAPIPPPEPIAAAPTLVEPTPPAAPLPVPAIAPAPEPGASPTLPPPAPPPAPPPEPPRGDRGRFLDLTDEGQQYRAAGDLDEALERYTAALAIARKNAAANPDDLVAGRDLAAALTHVGEVHDRDGRLDAAIALHEESLAVRRRLADAAPGDLAGLAGLSTGLERLADARDARGHRSRARDLFRLRLQLAQMLAARAPGDPDLASAVATTRERLAELDQALAV